jgi:D-aspartate ligase
MIAVATELQKVRVPPNGPGFMTTSASTWLQASGLEPWLRQLPADKPLAIILGGSCNGLSFVRSLARRGVPTLMLDSAKLLGAYTRFGKVVMLPPADLEPGEWIDFLRDVASRLKAKAVLMPTSDQHCLLISRNREVLQRDFQFLLPEREQLDQIIDKRQQYQLAEQVGVPIPKVRFPESRDQAQAFAREFNYPCVLKPYISHAARSKLNNKKLEVVNSAAELVAAYDRLSAAGVPAMIQEIVPGGDDALYGYLGFWDANGREVTWLTKRKLRQYPPNFGDGSLQISTEAPEVAELARKLLRHFNYRGFVGVEFKKSAVDGAFRLMEINPRTVSGNQLAISAGIDFPWIGYQHLTGRPVTPVEFTPGVKYLNEEWDVQAFGALHREKSLSFFDWLKSLSGVRAYALGAWDDPMPLLAGLGRAFRVVTGGSR